MLSTNLFRHYFHLHSCSCSSIKGKGGKRSLQKSFANFQVITSLFKVPNFTPITRLRPHKTRFLLSPSRTLKYIVFPQKTGQQVFRRTAVTSAMAQKEVEMVKNGGDVLGEMATVIRYQPGNERFQMQINLQNGRTFNFDRKVEDTVSSVLSRMVTNISKKVKNFNGTVKFLSENGNDVNLNEETTPMEKLLGNAFSYSFDLKLQVDEQVYEVVLNPPEIHLAKFFNVYMPTFPLFPYRMETSDNFDKKKSLYKWEFSREKPIPGTPPKSRKKAKNESISNADNNLGANWVECGLSFTFTPEPGMEGGYLRFSCTPSNGKMFGKSFSMVLTNPIVPLQVDTFLYQERLSRLSPKKEEGDCLRVLSYNVLADTYATPEWFISSPKESLDVGYRLPILNKEITAYQADLICLQEVDEKYFEGNFEPYLSLQGFKGRHTSKIGNTKEGIATFHNPSKLTEIQFNYFVILEHMKTLPLWEKLQAVGNDFIERLEERNTVFQVSIFQVNQLKKKTLLILGNVHLYFHPDADHIRLLQTITCIKILENVVAKVKQENPDAEVMVMFCGDFNCTPPFSSYRLLTTGQLNEDDEDWTSNPEEKISPGISIKHSLNLTNCHPDEELTNITTCFEGCLDYILYQADHFELLSTCPPPNKESLVELTKADELRKVSLPNFYTPSDHLPLIADFKIKS